MFILNNAPLTFWNISYVEVIYISLYKVVSVIWFVTTAYFLGIEDIAYFIGLTLAENMMVAEILWKEILGIWTFEQLFEKPPEEKLVWFLCISFILVCFFYYFPSNYAKMLQQEITEIICIIFLLGIWVKCCLVFLFL